MSDKPKFKCKSNAQKYAIRAYYAKKSNAGKRSQDCEEQRERYMKVMREDFPKDFISDDEWDYIEAMAGWSEKRED